MECLINDTRVKLKDGEIYSFIKKGNSRSMKWYLLKGCLSYNSAYKRIRINKKIYYYHRVIYKLHNNEWDIADISTKNFMDHIDRDKLNNNINNLRVVSQQQNCFNRTCKGYHYHKNTNKYRACIMINGEKKSYTVNTEEEAIKKREELKIKYHTI